MAAFKVQSNVVAAVFSQKKNVKTITLYAVQYYIFVSNANKASLMCSKLLYTLLYTLIN